mmetsp:Transcript_62875/g.166832  ORF Transcript_62875/g.166832 Transcript_62875/m.166832 type:complete len:84 (+) Transcript_62875:236-487(+)
MVAETDVCGSVAGSPGRPVEVLDNFMQVPARCVAAGTLVPAEQGPEPSCGSVHSATTLQRDSNNPRIFIVGQLFAKKTEKNLT